MRNLVKVKSLTIDRTRVTAHEIESKTKAAGVNVVSLRINGDAQLL